MKKKITFQRNEQYVQILIKFHKVGYWSLDCQNYSKKWYSNKIT